MRILIGLVLFLISFQVQATEYLVKYKDQRSLQSLAAALAEKSSGATLMEVHEPGQYAVVDVRSESEIPTLANLSARPEVEYVVQNFQLHALTAPFEGPELMHQWAMARVNATQAWERAGNKGSKNVLVAVIDTGIDYTHANLLKSMVGGGYDFRNSDEDPMDETGPRNAGHGTHCAGVIAADGSVDQGIIGIAPEVSVMAIRFLGADGSGDLNNGIKSIDYAIAKGAKVISASWGAKIREAQAKPLIEAVKRANDAGVIFVAAAANNGKNNDVFSVYPANAVFENTITVAASGKTDRKPGWSNYGKSSVAIAAPGDGILSTLPSNKYGNMSGTSMATPLVAGLVALLKSQDPTLTGAQIKALMQTSGAKVDIETACDCRIDAFAAVDMLLSKKMWPVPAAASLAPAAKLDLTVMNGQAPFVYQSSKPEVLTVSETGSVTAVAAGEATIKITDAQGQSVMTSSFNVIGKDASNPSCPFGPEYICRAICKFAPRLKMCQ